MNQCCIAVNLSLTSLLSWVPLKVGGPLYGEDMACNIYQRLVDGRSLVIAVVTYYLNLAT